MMTIDIEQLRKDMEAGTQGDWEAALERGCHGVIAQTLPEGGANMVALIGNDTDTPEREPTRFANARRIARLPDLEQAYMDLHEQNRNLREALADITDKYMDDSYAGVVARAALAEGETE